MRRRTIQCVVLLCGVACALASASDDLAIVTFVNQYCIDCHSGTEAEGQLDVTSFVGRVQPALPHADAVVGERMLRRLRTRQMPPVDATRPSEEQYVEIERILAASLDSAARQSPRLGRTEAIRRLSRTEYGNAVCDLLGLRVDVTQWLPADAAGHGFDNVNVSDLSPVLMSRYLQAAEEISRLAVGRPPQEPASTVFRVPSDRTQDRHLTGLPLGTRGGGRFAYYCACGGEFEIRGRLSRDRDEHVEGLTADTPVDIIVDRELLARVVIPAPRGQGEMAIGHETADLELMTRCQLTAGEHEIVVTFPGQGSALLSTRRQPFDVSFNRHRHPRQAPAVAQVTVTGPFQPNRSTPSPSRQQLFAHDIPQAPDSARARAILTPLMRLAYRRPVTDDDLQLPLQFFADVNATAGFDAGLEAALSTVLANPHFWLRVEQDPPELPSETVYDVDAAIVATRLGCFLWSSIPDDELLQLAEKGALTSPDVLEAQVRRMLADPRSDALVSNFAGQWLYLRNLDNLHPDMRLFIDFDDNLREAMRCETELAMRRLLRQDRSVLELLHTDTTYLNDRLAQHYGVAGVGGSHFRPVTLAPTDHRGGLLRHASLLAVTSYATRTAPTIRGNWLLKNVLGTPPPPPPPNVPALKDEIAQQNATVRQRLAAHRENPACAGCHQLMDPLGLAFENYDAVGRWRQREADAPIDCTGVLPDGTPVASVDDVEASLLARPDVFVTTMTEKLLVFALGRGLTTDDAPAVRSIVRRAREHDYRFSELITAVVCSDPFLQRTTACTSPAE